MATSIVKPTRHDVYPFIDPRDGMNGAANGKIVLVTGAGTGIGRGIAEAFALAGAAEVVIAARRTHKLEETRDSIKSLASSCKVSVFGETDVSDPASVKKLFAALATVPDVVISNAGAAVDKNMIEASDVDLTAQTIDINFKGPYLVARAYAEALRTANNKEGCLVNVSSEGSWKFIPRASVYGATKAGVNLLTEFLQGEQELTGGRLRCVAMHPGGVVTELAGELIEEVRHLLIDTPQLPGGTAVYLSTDRARFLMGRYVPATADMEELEQLKKKIVEEDMLKTRVVGWFGAWRSAAEQRNANKKA